jgi:putative membrane protein
MTMGGGGGMAAAMVFGLVVWIALIGLAGWALGRYFTAPRTQPPRTAERETPLDTPLETPLEILERRYAEGSIDAADFDEARARIRADDLGR